MSPTLLQAQYVFIYNCLLHEYLYGETEVNRDTIRNHFDYLLEMFPDAEESRLEKEFQVFKPLPHTGMN